MMCISQVHESSHFPVNDTDTRHGHKTQTQAHVQTQIQTQDARHKNQKSTTVTFSNPYQHKPSASNIQPHSTTLSSTQTTCTQHRHIKPIVRFLKPTMSYTKKGFEGVELPTNPNMPAWVLTPKEEQLVFERWRTKTFARCDDMIKAYIACSNSYENPLDAMKECEGANRRSLDCVASYQKMQYLDDERDILISEKRIKQKLYREKLKEQTEQK